MNPALGNPSHSDQTRDGPALVHPAGALTRFKVTGQVLYARGRANTFCSMVRMVFACSRSEPVAAGGKATSSKRWVSRSWAGLGSFARSEGAKNQRRVPSGGPPVSAPELSNGTTTRRACKWKRCC